MFIGRVKKKLIKQVIALDNEKFQELVLSVLKCCLAAASAGQADVS